MKREALEGSLSAASTPILASKYSLESFWRDLQDLPGTFFCTAQTSIFEQKFVESSRILSDYFQNSYFPVTFPISMLNVDEILSEFRER